MELGRAARWILLSLVVVLVAARIGWDVWLQKRMSRITAARSARVTPEIDGAPAPVTGPTLIGPEGTDEYGYPRLYVDRPLLRTLLLREEYGELTRRLEELERAYEKDWHAEDQVSDALQALAVPELAVKPKLDAWVALPGRSWAPHLVRGLYGVELGYAQRGTATVDKTASEDLRVMARTMTAADADLEHAVSLEPRLVWARRGQMQAATAVGDRERLDATYAQAAKICPLCFGPRVAYVLDLMPRWGGSYEEALRFARGERGNPRFKLLAGYVDLDRSQVLASEKRMDEALTAADRACAAGEWWMFLVHRGRVRTRSDPALALQDLDRALALAPGKPWVLFARAEALGAAKRYSDAGRDLLAAIRADPVNREVRRLRPYIVQGLLWETGQHVKALQPEQALASATLARELDPQNRDLQGKRSSLTSARTDSGQVTLAALKERAEKSPDDRAILQEYDHALAREGRFQEVVDLWTGYLHRHPDDARAYMERGGAYFQSGRRAEAVADARRACELGLNEACARAKMLEK
jgi:tetratricopeptide (TPR) repeat protein